MTGFETLAELKRAPDLRDIPVVVLSIIEDPEIGFRLGASDFLTKPIDRDRLIERISRLLGGKENRDVLLVDDDESVRTAVKVILQSQHYNVRPTGSAEEALEELAKARCDLILLDLMLPGISGTDFLLELRRHPQWKDIPVVVLTAAGPEAQSAALNAGAKIVIGKPFSEASLTELVKGVLEKVASAVGSRADQQFDGSSVGQARDSEGTGSQQNETTALTEETSAQNNSSR